MKGKMCKLYDENLVKGIIMSTAFTIIEFLKETKCNEPMDILEFVRINADQIIQNAVLDAEDIDSGSYDNNNDDPDNDITLL
jgi:hypothetical protein